MRPLINVSTAVASGKLLWPCRITKVKLKMRSSSLFSRNMNDGVGDTGEDSGS